MTCDERAEGRASSRAGAPCTHRRRGVVVSAFGEETRARRFDSHWLSKILHAFLPSFLTSSEFVGVEKKPKILDKSRRFIVR